MKKVHEIPYFIQMRGCINCSISKSMKERTGHDYGFNHELIAGCLLHECFTYGYTIAYPFIDPKDVVEYARREGNEEAIGGAKRYCLGIKERFGKFFDRLGISLDDMVNDEETQSSLECFL